MGLSCRRRLLRDREDAAPGGLVTVTLVVDYLDAAQVGAWIAFETDFIRTGSTLCFAQSSITADGVVCARAQARFRVLTSPTSRLPASSPAPHG